jgi:undecaprenyl-diphosphatase
MMVYFSELVSALIIAVVQGLTEWIPVSSTGHLVLFERLLSFQGGLVFDVALHFGTLMAVFVYFGGDIVEIVRDVLSGRWDSGNGRLGILVIVATVPAAIVGFLLRDLFEIAFTSLGVTALGFAVTGLFLFISSMEIGKMGSNRKVPTYSPLVKAENGVSRKVIGGGRDVSGDGLISGFGYGKAILVGVAQVFALFPGISRAGATIGSGLLLGLDEKEAMKFSFLMSVPVIFGANLLAIGNSTLPPEMVWATLVSFVVGLATIHLLYRYVLTSKKNLRWFGVYALLLGAVLGGWVFFR